MGNGLTNVTLNTCLIGPGRSTQKLREETGTITAQSAGFAKVRGHEWYEPKYTSPARGKGMVQEWMTNALDIRKDPAFPRLRDGKVDLGCYQCWLDPVGLWFSIR